MEGILSKPTNKKLLLLKQGCDYIRESHRLACEKANGEGLKNLPALPATSQRLALPPPRFFRPRLNLSEVKFLIGSLSEDRTALEQKLAYLKTLDCEVRRLRDLVLIDPGEALRQGLADKRIELEQLQHRRYAIWESIRLHACVIQRLENLASAPEPRGRPRNAFSNAKTSSKDNCTEKQRN